MTGEKTELLTQIPVTVTLLPVMLGHTKSCFIVIAQITVM